MKVSPEFYKTITGTIKKVIKKGILPGEKFYTPPCVICLIPSGTTYYKIVLFEGAEKKSRYSPNNSTIIEKEIELRFFEFHSAKKNCGENLISGKKYQFYTSGETWVNGWKEIAE